MRKLSFITIFFAVLFASASAHATAEFPGLIQQHLNITCANDGGTPVPDCMICHQSDLGGLGTATRPFGAWMKSNGLTAFNDSKLDALLDLANKDAIDSNCDGIPDITELEACNGLELETESDAGMNCNGTAVTILYGCSTSPTPAKTNDEAPLSAAAIISFALVAGIVFARVSRRKKRA